MRSPDRLPPLLRGRRRGRMALLVGTALAHTAFAVGAGVLVGSLLGDTGAHRGWIVADLTMLAVCVIGLGITRYAERVVAERLGQDYVQELRRGLISHAMTSNSAPSLGITIARSTNDLASVRNWISLGISPLVAFVPLAAGSLGLLWYIHWQLALAVAIPLLLMAGALALLARPAFERARVLRKRRGRLAARIADTVAAADGIVAAGGLERELRAIDRSGSTMVDAAIHRARTAGQLRACTLSASVLASGAAAALGAFEIIDTASVAMSITIIGVLGAPVSDLGKVVEYRQNHRAARRIIAPLLSSAVHSPPVVESPQPADEPATQGGRVLVRGLAPDGVPMPTLVATPGDRILVEASSEARSRSLFRSLAAPREDSQLSICVDGEDLLRTAPKVRRCKVGHAARGAKLERGTIARAVRYRRPELDEVEAVGALVKVGLGERLRSLPDRERTTLRRGGEPLDRKDVARLVLARAVLGTPPLLLLEHIDSDLGADGSQILRTLIDDYPGVVVFASDHPERVARAWKRWPVDNLS